MNKPLLKLINSMEKGWKLKPFMFTHMYFRRTGSTNVCSYPLSHKDIVACCAIGHGFLGVNPDNIPLDGSDAIFPILYDQHVVGSDGEEMLLFDAITSLNDEYGWTTPQITEWLRSHL